MIKWNNDPEWLRRMLNEVGSYHKSSGHIALDIGMNLGAWSLLNYKKFDHIYAFEPSYDSYHKATSTLHSFNITNVYPYNLAVWDKAGQVLDLSQHPKHGRSGNARVNTKWKNAQSEKCYTIDLNEIYELIGTKKIDYIKIDTEGAEWNILRGGWINEVKTVSMEIHNWIGEEKLADVYMWLSAGHKQLSKEGNVETWTLR